MPASSVTNPVARIFATLAQILDEAGLGADDSLNNMTPAEIQLIKMASKMSLEDIEMNLDIESETIDSELKRKLMRQFLDLKRILDKEGGYILTESNLQKRLFAKTSLSISILVRCMQVSYDLECTTVICNQILRILNASENHAANCLFLAKKNICNALFKSMVQFLKEPPVTSLNNQMPTKFDEFCVVLINLSIKMIKHESKLALLARMFNMVSTVYDIMARWFEKKDFTNMMNAIMLLRHFGVKNENNLAQLQKTDILTMLESCLKLSTTYSGIKVEVVLDMMVLLAKSGNFKFDLESWSKTLLETFGIKYMFAYCQSNVDSVQKSALKLVRSLISYNFGLNAFVTADGPKNFTELLQTTLQSADSASTFLSSANSIPSLLVGILRFTISQSDLPFLEEVKERVFPLPASPSTRPNTSTSDAKTTDSSINYDVYIGLLVDELQKSIDHGEAGNEVLYQAVKKTLMGLSPEFEFIFNVPKSENNSVNGSIRVKHVQPMFPGKHGFCKHVCHSNAEQLLKRSPLNLRKVIFEQTTRMFQEQTKGELVYDVMSPSVASQAGNESLKFESRFESGNLQLAIKTSPSEYDLLIQSDINASYGKHNQWFFFSVQGMQANTTYKFNILNLSKPGSQFNNGMQPVLYTVSDNKWKRMGDAVFYMKNHYRKCDIQSMNKAGETSDVNTYASLTFQINLKTNEEICYIAYHYPYTSISPVLDTGWKRVSLVNNN